MKIKIGVFALLLGMSCCSFLLAQQLQRDFGASNPTNRAPNTAATVDSSHFTDTIRPIVENRCVVCHACYDAPCQLKMESTAGIERGANKDLVYNGTRLLAGNLTRLFEDANTTQQWREKGFFPVLNERAQTAAAQTQNSVLYRILQLKRDKPMPHIGALPAVFDFSLDRDQSCPTSSEFDNYARAKPLAGMPYGLPALNHDEHQQLSQWIEAGAAMPDPVEPSSDELEAIARWELFFNGDDLKNQLMNRYIYEHLFLANLYFESLDHRRFFKLVRSATPPGQALERISTRRPFDDPKVARVYYRLIPNTETIIAKTHMPYRLSAERMANWREWFIDAPYSVKSLPSYDPTISANPFKAFVEIPPAARYRFMLEEAQFTIMGFIKGPVCRGQIALNVINDYFWVVFLDSDYPDVNDATEFLATNSNFLDLPAERESSAGPLSGWLEYSKLQLQYLQARDEFLNKELKAYQGPSLNMIWQGDGSNKNAALTIFRHFDTATVSKGLVGQKPNTAWVISYPLLERIHYLLVAGFDVYGNVGHQLLTRTYMDFLRMEGEENFLNLLPEETRVSELQNWYRGADEVVATYFNESHLSDGWTTQLAFSSDDPKSELFDMLRAHLRLVDDQGHQLDDNPQLSPASQKYLQQLHTLQGNNLQWLADNSIILLNQPPPFKPATVSLLLNKAHRNITSLLREDHNRLPAEDTLTVAAGIVGVYPNAYFRFDSDDLPVFIDGVRGLKSEADYARLLDRFGVRRNNLGFWPLSDQVHQLYQAQSSLWYGLLDYNRLENR